MSQTLIQNTSSPIIRNGKNVGAGNFFQERDEDYFVNFR